MNNAENVHIALQYCKECGHTELGYLGSTTGAENFNERHIAFLRYVKELNFQFDSKNEFRVKPTMLGAHDDFQNTGSEPGASLLFFAENDTIALGAMKALKEKGYKIPNDVSLIGFDDIPYSSISSPTLTTIHVQRKIMGKQSVIQLMQLSRGSPVHAHEDPDYGKAGGTLQRETSGIIRQKSPGLSNLRDREIVSAARYLLRFFL